MVAASEGQLGVLQVLIEAKCDINLLSTDGMVRVLFVHDQIVGSQTALCYAIERNHLDAAKLLLAARADPALCRNSLSPMHIACWNGSEEIVTALLELKVDALTPFRDKVSETQL